MPRVPRRAGADPGSRPPRSPPAPPTSRKCSSVITRSVVVPAARSRRRLAVARRAWGTASWRSWPIWSPSPGTIEMWLCASTRPGITKRSLQSSTAAPGGHRRGRRGPDRGDPRAVQHDDRRRARAARRCRRRACRSGSRGAGPSGRPATARASAVVAPRGLAESRNPRGRRGGPPPDRARRPGRARRRRPVMMRTRSPRRDRMLGRLAHVPHRPVGRGDLHPVDRAVLPAREPPGRRRPCARG